MYNILNHTSETERIVFEDSNDLNGFILLPDIKWDGHTVESLYLLAIIRQKNVKSIRDLNENHLALLKNIRDKSLDVIETKYNLKSTKIKAYLHYQPSFYHLHIHFTHLYFQNSSTECERAHLLNTVIDNIEVCPDYYQKANINFVIRKNDSLYDYYKDRI